LFAVNVLCDRCVMTVTTKAFLSYRTLSYKAFYR